ncbi:MAG TPA: MIP/aquaporin family protein [Haliscomenobacter sp.]|uniref:MIP/aquaporin family protein n=1 Tax=Haliscomenobacter sp. TaxID=2717303 RepID=UPI001DE4087D|nr:MIP/aquaporin family protein [Haliscomenobacter sp.]MBK9487919.1 aquaporin family protein [Haliscomenobacter sp.]HOY17790.1 MIP/aquaporin family protein [Haliscomenobacter sp.]HPH17214.1 MIP/aquaporin family protein [Haliscomenobacter sp.]
MITSPFLGELIGTMVLILLGNGVVANVLLSKTKGNNGGLIAITAGWGFAVTMGIFIAQKFGSPAAHLNPAVTIAMAVKDNNFSNVLPFISAQLLGAILGATLVWLHHLPHWGATNDQSLKLAAFSTSPAIPNAPANLISEIIGTLVLVIGVIALYAEAGSGMAPLLVGVLVWSIGLSLGGTTGYAINPARDLGPRIAHAILPIAGKGGSEWGYAWVPVVGPIVAALIAGAILNGFGF